MDTSHSKIAASRASLLAFARPRPVPFALARYRGSAMPTAPSPARGDIAYFEPCGRLRGLARLSQESRGRIDSFNTREHFLGAVLPSGAQPGRITYLDARGRMLGSSQEKRNGREVEYYSPIEALWGKAIVDPDRPGQALYVRADGSYLGKAEFSEREVRFFDAAGSLVGRIESRSLAGQWLALRDALGVFLAGDQSAAEML